MALRLPESLRLRLKEPLGDFVRDLSSLESKTLVCVGDQASKDAVAAGLKPLLCVYDGRIQRKAVGVTPELRDYDALEVRVTNPAGTISDEAFNAVERALCSGRPHKILVDGEEDLMTLVAIAYAPLRSVVLYGQPNEGLVGVTVTKKAKDNANSMLSEMQNGC
jgi:uncharacterized protein (UPF0218 family)